MPIRRIAFFGGISCFSSSRARPERLSALSMRPADLLRVINSKSENLTFSVAVRARARSFAVTPNLLDQRLQFRRQSFVVRQILREGVLGADRFADTVGADGALVDTARNPVIVGTGLAVAVRSKCP